MSLNVALCGKDKFGLADVRSSLNAMCISCILACEFFACSLLIVNVQRFPRLSQWWSPVQCASTCKPAMWFVSCAFHVLCLWCCQWCQLIWCMSQPMWLIPMWGSCNAMCIDSTVCGPAAMCWKVEKLAGLIWFISQLHNKWGSSCSVYLNLSLMSSCPWSSCDFHCAWLFTGLHSCVALTRILICLQWRHDINSWLSGTPGEKMLRHGHVATWYSAVDAGKFGHDGKDCICCWPAGPSLRPEWVPQLCSEYAWRHDKPGWHCSVEATCFRGPYRGAWAVEGVGHRSKCSSKP